MNMDKITSVHFIGVGGVGMSGIAKVAHDQGLIVTGSDIRDSRYTQQLREAGVTIHIGHDAANIAGVGKEDGPDVVVISTAVLENNIELRAAKERGLTIWHRAQMLAYLGTGLKTLAVAGTHGKTTTSSMMATVLDDLGFDPTFLIGGIVRAYGTNAHSGTGDYYVVEADESDKSFSYLSPYAVLITNIEADHLDHYKDLAEIREKFKAFIELIPEAQGIAMVCAEDPSVVELARSTGRNVKTYGFADGVDVQIVSYQSHGIGSTFSLRMPDGQIVESSIPQNPGKHNVLNAAGVIGLLAELGVPAADAARAVSDFKGVRRRFDLVGKADEVTVVDDYAHHPTEIAATISAAAELGYNNVHVLFQPHRYSRVGLFTEVLHDEFGSAFDKADTVTFMDVYSAGEAPVPGVSGKTFLNVVLDHSGHPNAEYVARRVDVPEVMAAKAKPGDLVITMGAGDVTAMGPQIIDALRRRSSGDAPAAE